MRSTVNKPTCLKARLACEADEALLLVWANDVAVRMNSFNSMPIAASTHHSWFNRCLSSQQTCRIYIAQTAEDFPVGQVRFDLKECGWSIDYSLDPSVRGRGFGTQILDLAINEFKKNYPDVIIFGLVKYENILSQRVFKKLNFSEQFNGKYFIYQKILSL